MERKLTALAVIFIFALSIGGCATTRKQQDLEIQGLKNQITALEAQVQAKDEEINSLKNELDKAQVQKIPAAKELKCRPSAKQIQTALKNAGFYSGTIDGRMGRQTREAIKSFQKANNLKADGRIGNQTWDVLKPYLDKKLK
jgi:peptidoglycan hydrolase-like protein with peptidoglycan-binding domain